MPEASRTPATQVSDLTPETQAALEELTDDQWVLISNRKGGCELLKGSETRPMSEDGFSYQYLGRRRPVLTAVSRVRQDGIFPAEEIAALEREAEDLSPAEVRDKIREKGLETQ